MNLKFISAFILICIIPLFSLSANAEAIFSGSADLANISNGSLTNINESTAQINVNNGAAGATVNWNTLNIPQNNTLNFYFPDVNQYALNKVANGITTIAGNVGYAEGSQAGTVIFSNPNGIVCTGSSVINVSSLLLTTHDVKMKDNIAQLTKQAGKDGNYHGILIEASSTLKLDNNLTIVSAGVNIEDANITSGKDTVMVTADGANYLLTTKETVITQNSTINANDIYFGSTKNNDNYGIKIANTAIKTNDGKLYLINTADKGNIKLAGNNIAADTNITAKNEVVFEDTKELLNSVWYIVNGTIYPVYYYRNSYIEGNTVINAPKVSINQTEPYFINWPTGLFNGKVDFNGLKELSGNGFGALYDDIRFSTYSWDMAYSILDEICNKMFIASEKGFVNLHIDIIPEEIKENANNDISIENKNFLSYYTNLIISKDKYQDNLPADKNLLLKALAADDTDFYKEEFLHTSVHIGKNGKLYTSNIFKN